jgi:long-chain acyl-CoA synthetase
MDEPRSFSWLDERVAERGSATYAHVKAGTAWRAISWLELRRGYLAVAGKLHALHRDRRPVVAILADTCFEWSLCDLATLAVGGVVVGIYVNDRDEVVRHILETSQPTIVAVQNAALLERLRRIAPGWGSERPVIVMQGVVQSAEHCHALADWLAPETAREDETRVLAVIRGRSAEDIASHVYTSGTSGMPKAAILTQGNLLHTAQVYARYYPVSASDSTLLFLPFAHVFSRVMHYAGLLWGIEIYFAHSIDDVATDLTTVRPTVLLVVPRVLERVKTKVLATVQASGRLARAIFRWSTAVGLRYFIEGRRDLATRLAVRLARVLVLGRMKDRFGGRIRFIGCGGGKLSQEIAQFFGQFDLPIYEGYATTESGGLGIFNRPAAGRPGTVGKPVPEIEVRLAGDGEVALRSASVFAGYLGDPAATRAVLEDGWLLTGDIGRFDRDGFLEIIDRKKDIIATANGKKVAPAWIESKLTEQQEISQAVVVGEGRPYLVSLIVAADQDAAVRERIARSIETVNHALARHEQIRRFHLVPEFALGTVAMTATLKLRREAIYNMYRDEIDQMYTQEA